MVAPSRRPAMRVSWNARFAVPLLAVALSVGPAARADQIDQDLLTRGKEIMKELHKQQYKNVGVLKFEAQRGGANGPVTFELGRLNALMATRLENVLILANDLKKPIGIVCGAGDLASRRDAKATYKTPAGREGLL